MIIVIRSPLEDMISIARSLQHEIRNALQLLIIDLECAELGSTDSFKSLEALRLQSDQLRLALKESEIVRQRIERQVDDTQLLYEIDFLIRLVKFFESYMTSNSELFRSWLSTLVTRKRELEGRVGQVPCSQP